MEERVEFKKINVAEKVDFPILIRFGTFFDLKNRTKRNQYEIISSLYIMCIPSFSISVAGNF